MAVNEVSITVKVDADQAKRQLDEIQARLGEMGLRSRIGGAGGVAGGAGGGGLFGGGFLSPGAIGLGAIASPALVPPAGALLGLGAFAAFAIPTFMKIDKALTSTGAAAKKAWEAMTPGQRDLARQIQDIMKTWEKMSAQLTPMVTRALAPVLKLGSDLLPLLKPLAEAGGKILDAFVRPLDRLVNSGTFDEFISVMAKAGLQFAKLFGPELASILGAVLRLFIELAPAGMALWRALGPLVTTLVNQLAGVLGKLLPPLARALASLLGALTPLIPPLAKILVALLLPVAKVIQDLAPLVAKLADAISVQLLKALMPLAKAWTQVINAMLPILPPLVKLINALLPPLIQLFSKPMIAALTGVANAINRYVVPAITWFVDKAVPWLQNATGKITGYFRDLGPNLLRLGRAAFTQLWDGIKSVGSAIVSWVQSFASGLLAGLKHAFGIGSPSRVMHAIGRNLMEGLFNGLKAHTMPVIGHLSGTAGQIQALMRAMAASRGWTGGQWAALNAVEMREAGYNPTATNPSSGAYGLAQFIGGPAEYFQWGGSPFTVAGQITGMLNYIASRYRTPAAAWAHEQQVGWYGSGLANGLFTRPTLIGVGERGPEMVNITPAGRGGSRIVLEVRGGSGEFEQFMAHFIRKYVRLEGGGDVQAAFGGT